MSSEIEDASLKAALRIFGDMLRRNRQKSEWSFCRLAEKLGIDENIISQLEAGENVGSEIEREKLCEFLGIDIDAFPKLLRKEQTRVATATIASIVDETGATNVVDLQRHREKWQRTTSHPEV
ncbi:hypothetical protein QA646_05390 [Rhizobium sp. CB3090]|uniref:helix-turn-helix domain-containing protein n=1 Tax=Rhizobium sp. CB3090 TaxID=3039156 RepID=UPI0024B22D1A|nr:helix-turn-helix domain-containing protein [Rhizobium sp. CB3090]WFU10292.1 hypothetical protein QA646_05390 [Rhizobium sp. CB3090]